MLTNILLFVLFLLLFTIVPAYTFLRLLRIKLTDDSLISLSIYIILGIVIVTLTSLILRVFGMHSILLWAMPLISLLYLLWQKNIHIGTKSINLSKSSFNISVLIVILIGIITQNIIFLNGGSANSRGIILPLARDSMWNIALVGELSHSFLPEHPGLAGIMLKNNHFLYHILIAVSYQITKIDIVYLYYRFWPIVVSLLFGTSIYAVSSILTKNSNFRALTVLLGYFSGTFAFLLPLFLGSQFNWRSNTFYTDQPFDQIGNPYTVFGFALFLFGIYALSQIAKSNSKVKTNWIIITSLLLGSLYGFKSFGGTISIIAVFITIILLSIYWRYKYLTLILPATLLIFLPVFFVITDISKTSLIFNPGWILHEMFVGIDKLNLPNIASSENYYFATGNLKGIIKIKSIEFLVYFIGNLGTRIIGFLYLANLFISNLFYTTNRSRNWTLMIVFCTVSSLIAFTIPLLFNLRNSPYDIIQFTPYALIIWAIFTAIAIEQLYYKLNTLPIFITLAVIFLVLTIPVSLKSIIDDVHYRPDIISFDEFQVLKYIRNNSKGDNIILINPSDYNYEKILLTDPMYISALSQRRLYLGSEGFTKQVGYNWEERLKNVENFFSGKLGYDFLIRNNIKYVYVPEKFLYKTHFSKDAHLRPVIMNKTANLYEVKYQ